MATKRLGKGLEALIRSSSQELLEDSKSSGISSVLIFEIKSLEIPELLESSKSS